MQTVTRERLIKQIIQNHTRAYGAIIIESYPGQHPATELAPLATSAFDLDNDHIFYWCQNLMARRALQLSREPPPILINNYTRLPELWPLVLQDLKCHYAPGRFLLITNGRVIWQQHQGSFGVAHIVPMRTASTWEKGDSDGRISVKQWRHQRQLLTQQTLFRPTFVWSEGIPSVTNEIWPLARNRWPPPAPSGWSSALRQLVGTTFSPRALLTRLQCELPAYRKSDIQTWLQLARKNLTIDFLPAWQPKLKDKAAGCEFAKLILTLSEFPSDDDTDELDLLVTRQFLCQAANDWQVYLDATVGRLGHYRDNYGRHVDLVAMWPDGQWALINLARNERTSIEAAVRMLVRVRANVTDDIAASCAFLMVNTPAGKCYQRADGVWVVPLTHLGP